MLRESSHSTATRARSDGTWLRTHSGPSRARSTSAMRAVRITSTKSTAGRPPLRLQARTPRAATTSVNPDATPDQDRIGDLELNPRRHVHSSTPPGRAALRGAEQQLRDQGAEHQEEEDPPHLVQQGAARGGRPGPWSPPRRAARGSRSGPPPAKSVRRPRASGRLRATKASPSVSTPALRPPLGERVGPVARGNRPALLEPALVRARDLLLLGPERGPRPDRARGAPPP